MSFAKYLRNKIHRNHSFRPTIIELYKTLEHALLSYFGLGYTLCVSYEEERHINTRITLCVTAKLSLCRFLMSSVSSRRIIYLSVCSG